MKCVKRLMFLIFSGFILFSCSTSEKAAIISLDDWTYIEVDSSRAKWGDWDKPEWLRYFGLWMDDITGDGYQDLIAGRYFYRNPGGDMTAKWPRIDLGFNVDGMLFVNVDDDEFGDVIATALPTVYWLEATDKQGESWNRVKIGEIPPSGHVNGQGYELAQIIPGCKPEILLASGKGTFYFQIPENPDTGNWPSTRINDNASEEGIGIGDIDGDGLIDIAAGTGGKDSGGEGMVVSWYKNPGNSAGNWKQYNIGTTIYFADRFEIADINGDSKVDIVVTEERWPGPDPDASLFWYEQPSDPTSKDWQRHTVVTEYSLNNLDIADMEKDGDVDIITCEHKGPKEKLQIWENDGQGNFTEHLIDEGKESHLGSQVTDLDNDGDLDIVSIVWDEWKYLHIWRNDAIKNK